MKVRSVLLRNYGTAKIPIGTDRYVSFRSSCRRQPPCINIFVEALQTISGLHVPSDLGMMNIVLKLLLLYRGWLC